MTTTTPRPTRAETTPPANHVARLVVVDLDDPRLVDRLAAALDGLVTPEWAAHAAVDVLARLAETVEQAEDETTGYTEPDTGAFVGSRRPRYVGPWEEA